MTGEPARILLIEDEPAHAELVRRAFDMSRLAAELVVAERLSEARAWLAQHAPPQLIISDWRLPDGDGLEILAGEYTGLPVIIMTSHGNERVAVEALKAGALDYVVKSDETLLDMPHIAERAIRERTIADERNRIQAALRSSEERLRTIISNAPVIFWATDQQGMFTAAEGSGLAEMFATGAAVGRTVFEVFQAVPAAIDSFQRALAGDAHILLIQPPASRLIFETWFSPLYDPAGVISGVIGVATDITERKQAEEALRASEQKFSRAFHDSPTSMIIIRLADGVYLDVNDVFCQMSGYSREETIGNTQRELKLWVSEQEQVQANERLERDGAIRDLEVSLRRKNGEMGIVSLSAVIVDVSGERCTLVTLHDVTARRQAEEALRLSEEKFNKAFKSSPVAMAISDRTTRYYLDVNDAFARMTGYAREELVGRTARDLQLWVDLREREQVVRLTDQQDFVRGEEIHFQNRSGEVRVAQMSLELVDMNGVPCMLASFQDVTERRQFEDALRASEDRFRTLVQNSQDIILVHDPHGVVMYESPSVAAVLGYPPGALLGKSLLEFVPAEDVPVLQRMFEEVAQRQHDGVSTEFRFHRADRSLIYLEALGVNLLDYPGVRGIVITSRDVTERKLAESALRQYAERLSILHEIDQAILSAKSIEEIADAALSRIQRSVPCWQAVVVVFDTLTGWATTVSAYCNGQKQTSGERYALQALGALVALPAGELYTVDDLRLQPQAWPFSGQLAGREARSCIYAPLLVLGRQIGLLGLDSRLPQAFQGAALDVVSEVADQLAVAIQNAQLLEQTQRHAQELQQRVAERTRELAEANERLTELDRLKSKFVSDVSHELRTPIANLKLHVELLEQGRPEKRALYLNVVKQQARRLGQLVDDILNLSRLEIGRERVTFGPVDLNFVVDQIVTAHQPRAEAAGLMLRFRPANVAPVRGEVNQLAQVVTNLVANALSYTPAGSVQVSTGQISGEVCLEVADTGFGIDVEDLPNIFARFYRGRRSQRSETPGTGLGLAIVKEIVDMHGGRIEVESQVKQGTTFRVWLPLYRSSHQPAE
jgi:PAS domain S-box-containing protein